MEIILPKRKSYYNLMILLLLVGFTAYQLTISEPDHYILVIFAMIIPIGTFTIFTLYLFFGYEKVTTNEIYLILSKKLFIQNETIKIKLSEIKHIEYRQGGENPANVMLEPLDWRINRMSNIAIIKEKKIIKFGLGIYDFEAQPIIEKLNEIILQSK